MMFDPFGSPGYPGAAPAPYYAQPQPQRKRATPQAAVRATPSAPVQVTLQAAVVVPSPEQLGIRFDDTAPPVVVPSPEQLGIDLK